MFRAMIVTLTAVLFVTALHRCPMKNEMGPECYDLMDNDRDTMTDCEDPDCWGEVEECVGEETAVTEE